MLRRYTWKSESWVEGHTDFFFHAQAFEYILFHMNTKNMSANNWAQLAISFLFYDSSELYKRRIKTPRLRFHILAIW